jgi:hypothetical protein
MNPYELAVYFWAVVTVSAVMASFIFLAVRKVAEHVERHASDRDSHPSLPSIPSCPSSPA